MDQSLSGRAVVVTGGTGFLGSAVVDAMLARGARCHVTWVTENEKERFGQKAGVELHRLNASDEREVEAFYGSWPELWGSIHTVGGFAMATIEKTSAEEMRRMFEMNTLTAFLCSREAIKKMRASGKGGRIVNVAARPAIVPTAGMIAYATTKA